MTREEFKDARTSLGYTQNGLAAEWGMGEHGGRTIRRWEQGDRPINAAAIYCLKMMLQNGPLNAD